jgi:hypothetical protein
VKQENGAISAYADALAGWLSFDRALQRSVREEVENHLWEAAAADPAGDPREAQRRAIARFGDPRRIAAQFAAVALAGQARKIGVTVLLVLAGVLLAMTTRVAWYDLTQWGLCESAVELGETLGLVDRAAFLLAAIGGVAGWAWSGGRLRLWAIASAGLVASVICDGLLTALRLSGWEFSVDFLVPLFSMALEIAFAGILVFHINRLARRSAAYAQIR